MRVIGFLVLLFVFLCLTILGLLGSLFLFLNLGFLSKSKDLWRFNQMDHGGGSVVDNGWRFFFLVSCRLWWVFLVVKYVPAHIGGQVHSLQSRKHAPKKATNKVRPKLFKQKNNQRKKSREQRKKSVLVIFSYFFPSKYYISRPGHAYLRPAPS